MTLTLAVTRRTLRRNGGTDLGRFLERLARELEEDRESLLEVMRALGFTRNRAKEGGARALERAGLLKLNGKLRGYSDLSRLEELEGLCVGIEGKRGLWVSLHQCGRQVPADLAALVERAVRQREEIEQHRIAAARRALRVGRSS